MSYKEHLKHKFTILADITKEKVRYKATKSITRSKTIIEAVAEQKPKTFSEFTLISWNEKTKRATYSCDTDFIL